MERHIGIYSGTFDPIHSGHIAFAQEAMRICHIDNVVFLPETQPRVKNAVTPIADRLKFIQNAIADIHSLSVIQLASTQFSTATTLPELQTVFNDAKFTLLLGSDVVRTFLYRWKDLHILLGQVSLAIGMRDGDTVDEITSILKDVEMRHKIAIDYTFIYTDHSHVASTHIRNSVQN